MYMHYCDIIYCTQLQNSSPDAIPKIVPELPDNIHEYLEIHSRNPKVANQPNWTFPSK